MAAPITRVTWKPYSMYKSLCMLSPLLICRFPGGHQETKAQPRPKYISHALSRESAETLRTRGSPKIRNETPNPKARASKKLTTIKKGNWPGEGAIPRGCQITWPSRKAGTVTSRVTTNTLTQPLRLLRAPFGTWADKSVIHILLTLIFVPLSQQVSCTLLTMTAKDEGVNTSAGP